jgi:phage terminase large subunit
VAGLAPVIVEIPYRPRPLQRIIHTALDAHRWAVAVCHRRFGKSVLAVNHLQKAATTCKRQRPRFAYISPTYRQGKASVWDYMKYYAAPIPGHKVNESELRIDYPNEGQVRLFGADNPDALRGLYFDGVVFDEFGLQPPNIFSEVVRPLLADRGGWALFIGTPNGKNQFWDIAQRAQLEPDWFFAEYKASDTGILPIEELQDSRRVMTEDEYAQEYECSFEASVKGAVYAREMQQAREDGRITRVPYDPTLPVDTDWDLGFADNTSIWFSQSLRSREVRLIDYYENSGFGLDHYRKVLQDRPYAYGQHWAPHDIEVRELGSGNSRLQAARDMGLNFTVGPKVQDIQDGIHAARMLLPRCWFDVAKTDRGIEALRNYRWDYNTKVRDFTTLPVHNWASHAADAFRGLAYRHYVANPVKKKAEMRDRDPDDPRVRLAAVRGSGRKSGRGWARRGGY